MAIPITDAFKRFRRDLKLTQRDVARRLNISQPAYAVYESKGNSPTGATLIRMANEFNVSTDYLLGLIDEPRPWQVVDSKTPEVVVSSAPPENDKVVEAAIALVKALREQVEQDRREAAGDKEAKE